ncbi:hypothetical protein HanIR_Chr13g0628601 [Helianthus annuus]|nr:hypothetical protein HanIR_Chr13g0628601 [Helianthus annuus]
MYAPNEVDGESFTAQSAQGRLSSKSSLGMKVLWEQRGCRNAVPTFLHGHRLGADQ